MQTLSFGSPVYTDKSTVDLLRSTILWEQPFQTERKHWHVNDEGGAPFLDGVDLVAHELQVLLDDLEVGLEVEPAVHGAQRVLGRFRRSGVRPRAV